MRYAKRGQKKKPEIIVSNTTPQIRKQCLPASDEMFLKYMSSNTLNFVESGKYSMKVILRLYEISAPLMLSLAVS
jgi:hypothetical protein